MGLSVNTNYSMQDNWKDKSGVEIDNTAELNGFNADNKLYCGIF